MISNDSLAKFLLLITATLGSAGLEALVSKGRTLPSREAYKIEMSPG